MNRIKSQSNKKMNDATSANSLVFISKIILIDKASEKIMSNYKAELS